MMVMKAMLLMLIAAYQLLVARDGDDGDDGDVFDDGDW